MKTMPEILRELRTSKSMTQSDIAKLLGLTTNAYQSYERGTSEPSCKSLRTLADFYGVSVDYLLGREPSIPNPIAQLNVPDDTEAVIEALTKLPPAMQTAMVDILMQMYESVKARRAAEQAKPIVMTIRKHLHKAAAGFGYDLGNEDHWENIRVIQTDEAERADFTVEVEGDSMLPEFHDGDLALVVLTEDIEVGQTGLFIQNGKGYIKQKGEDCLISINPEYPNIYPKDGEIICVGRVIGVAELPE